MNLPGIFALGADIGWLPKMEKAGFVFKDEQGRPKDCIHTLRDDYGFNAARLRTFVHSNDSAPNASVLKYIDGYLGKRDTIDLACRCRNEGLRIMVDFHYSDVWANPQFQRKPALWERLSFDELLETLYEYTKNFMLAMRQAHVFAEWVQVGNETNPGLLLPEGSIDSPSRLAALYNAGYEAIKEVNPASNVLIHLAAGENTQDIERYFTRLKPFGCKYDMIGLSYYPYWGGKKNEDTLPGLKRTLQMIPARLNVPAMVVEIGSEVAYPQEQAAYIASILETIDSVPEAGKTGLFYWEPEASMAISHYNLCAWLDDGRPSSSMRAFLQTLGDRL